MAPELHLERQSALLAGVHCVEQAVCQVRQAAPAALQERLHLGLWVRVFDLGLAVAAPLQVQSTAECVSLGVQERGCLRTAQLLA